jgi:uncharacterized membrane protein
MPNRRGARVKQKLSISIWFFIGISLAVNGSLILAAGLFQLLNPPIAPAVVLFNLHANVWWGALLLAIGLFYCFHFAPNRRR